MELHFWQLANPLLAVVLALSIGGGLALLEFYLQAKSPSWFMAAMSLPLFLPQPIVGTMLIATLGKYHVLYQPAAVLIGYAYYNIPLAYILLSQALRQVPHAWIDTLTLFKANSWQKFKLVVWPVLRQPILQTGALVFLYCFTSFSLPLMLGGYQAGTIEVAIYQQWVFYHHTQTALQMAGLQTLGLLFVVYPLIRKTRLFQETQLTSEHANQHLGLTLLRSFLGLCVLLPALQIWEPLQPLTQTRFWPTLGFTIGLGISVAFIVALSSYLLRSYSHWALLLLCCSPISISLLISITVGKSTLWHGIVLAAIFLPLATLLVANRWQARPAGYDDLRALLTRTFWQRHHLNWIWLKPTLVTVFGFSIAYTLGDAAVASMLAPSVRPTAIQLALQLLGSYRFQFAASAMLYVLLTIFIIYLGTYAYRRTA